MWFLASVLDRGQSITVIVLVLLFPVTGRQQSGEGKGEDK